MVPEGWKLTTLGEVCDGRLQTGPFGSQLHAHEYVDNGIPVLMPKDLNNAKASSKYAAKITPEKAKQLAKHKLQTGDLLFSRRGDVTRFALIDGESVGSICGTGCLKARPSDKHSPAFLAYFLQKSSSKKWLEKNAVGQTMPNMNTEILRELPLISASSRAEEDKIAQILSTWDKAITTTEKLLANSQQQKKALMQQLLTGKKRLLDENGVRFSGKWNSIAIGELGKVVTGATPPKNDKNNYGDYLPWATADDFKQKYIKNTKVKLSEQGCKKARIVPPGSILVTCIASIGLNAIASESLATNQQINSIVVANGYSNEFIFYQLNKNQHKLMSLAGTTAVPIVNKSSFEKLALLIPSYSEQLKIARILVAQDEVINKLKYKVDYLKQEKKALMQQLLTGKRRVKINEDAA